MRRRRHHRSLWGRKRGHDHRHDRAPSAAWDCVRLPGGHRARAFRLQEM